MIVNLNVNTNKNENEKVNMNANTNANGNANMNTNINVNLNVNINQRKGNIKCKPIGHLRVRSPMKTIVNINGYPWLPYSHNGRQSGNI